MSAVTNRTAMALLAIGVLALFGVHAWFAVEWYAAGAFSFDDGFFDADPLSNLNALAHGWGRRSLIHPHLANFFAVPIRLLDVIDARLFGGVDRERFREYVALSISPIATLIATLAVYRTVVLLHASRRTAVLVSLLYASSFSMLLFGTIPEAFPISNALMALLFWYAASQVRAGSDGRMLVWSVLGFLLISMTITNAVAFFIIRALHRRYTGGESWRVSVLRAGAQTALVAGVAIGSGFLAIQLLGYQEEAARAGVGSYVTSFVSLAPASILRNLANLGLAMGQSMLSFGTMERPLRFCADLPQCHAVFFSHPSPSFLVFALGFGLLAAVAALAWSALKTGEHTAQWLGCLGILAFNIGLHAVFGTEMFLFSQHWVTPLLLLMVPRVHRAPTAWTVVLMIQLVVNLSAMSRILGVITPS